MDTAENEVDEIEKILSEKKEMIERKKQGIENCKIPYLEAIGKLRYPDDFLEITNIDTENYIVVRNGSKLRALCRDCERKDSLVEGDFAELAKYCLSASPGVWVEAYDKPQTQLRHENTLQFRPHSHPSLKRKGAHISNQPIMKIKLKNEEALAQLWRESWERMNKLRKELQALERAA